MERFKVGDEGIVIRNIHSHGIVIGDKVEILEVIKDNDKVNNVPFDEYYRVEDKDITWYIAANEMKKIKKSNAPTRKDLFIEFLETAIENDDKGYIGIAMRTPSTFDEPEIIINPIKNIESKLNYYSSQYGEDLEMLNNSRVFIEEYHWSHNIEDLLNKLMEVTK